MTVNDQRKNGFRDIVQTIVELFFHAGSEGWRVGIFPHERHDADAYGAAMSMSAVLETVGCETVVVLDMTEPPPISALPLLKEPLIPERGDVMPSLDLALAVDCYEASRMGKRAPFYIEAPRHAVIDHHIYEGDLPPFSYIDVRASATCELCYVLIEAMEQRSGRPLFTNDIAILLLAGIVTDTGRYTYSNTTPRVMRQAASLIERFSIDLPTLHYHLFDKTTLGFLQLRGIVFQNAQRSHNDRVISTHISRAMLDEYGIQDDDLAKIASELRSVEGTEVVLLHVETPDGVRLNIRAGENFNAAEFARRYGGGGHARAAGATIKNITLEEAMARTHRDIAETLAFSE
ncbi:MAG: DHH family phosphoesterase [Saccharofermentanales bacterium]|jgi:phosphoesterase RecJ-like protein